MEQIELKFKSRVFTVEFISETDQDNWLIVREVAPSGASRIVYNGTIKGFCDFFGTL